MVMNHAVNIDNDEHIGIRWYEMRREGNSGWDIYQEGTYAPTDDVGRFCGSIGIDEDGNIALGYTVSGASKFPSTRITGRRFSDPLGEMTATEIEVETGDDNASLASRRWGDYFSLSVDPDDGKTFILVHQVQKRNIGWQSYNTSFNIEKDELTDILPLTLNDQFPLPLFDPAQSLSVRILNNGTTNAENYEIGYSINGNDFIFENPDSVIAPNGSFSYEFQNQPTFDNPGSYELSVLTKLLEDQNTSNDTTRIEIIKPHQLDVSVLPIVGLEGNPCRTGGLLRLPYENTGLDTITNLKLGFFLNNDEPTILEVNSTILPGRSSTRTRALRNPRRGLNTMTYYTFDPNGAQDEVTSNDTIRQTFYANFEGEDFTLEFLSDNFPHENRWEILDQNGVLVDEGSITDGWTTTTICLDPAYCYTFKLYDLAGDGIVGDFEPGTYDLLNANGDLIITNISPEFGYVESIDFCGSMNCINETITSVSAETLDGNDDGAILVEPIGGLAPFSYQINNDPPVSNGLFSSLSGGDYTIQVTDARGCLDTINVMLPVCDLAVETMVINESAPGANDGSIKLITANANGLIEYSIDGAPFVQDSLIEELSDGEYTIIIRDEIGCIRELMVALDGTVSIQNLNFGKEIKVFPNPSSGIFKVEIEGEDGPIHAIQVYDINGRLIHENWLTQINGTYHSGVIALPGISDGIYFLKTQIKGQFQLKKLLINN
jgi:hypothetical protein